MFLGDGKNCMVCAVKQDTGARHLGEGAQLVRGWACSRPDPQNPRKRITQEPCPRSAPARPGTSSARLSRHYCTCNRRATRLQSFTIADSRFGALSRTSTSTSWLPFSPSSPHFQSCCTFPLASLLILSYPTNYTYYTHHLLIIVTIFSSSHHFLFSFFPARHPRRARKPSRPPRASRSIPWPLEMPNHWIMGAVTGVFVDAKQHVWVAHLPETLTEEELYEEAEAAPMGTLLQGGAADPRVRSAGQARSGLGPGLVAPTSPTGRAIRTACSSITRTTSGSAATAAIA